MQISDGAQLRKEWASKGNPPCDHPGVDKEYSRGSDTGDEVCMSAARRHSVELCSVVPNGVCQHSPSHSRRRVAAHRAERAALRPACVLDAPSATPASRTGSANPLDVTRVVREKGHPAGASHSFRAPSPPRHRGRPMYRVYSFFRALFCSPTITVARLAVSIPKAAIPPINSGTATSFPVPVAGEMSP